MYALNRAAFPTTAATANTVDLHHQRLPTFPELVAVVRSGKSSSGLPSNGGEPSLRFPRSPYDSTVVGRRNTTPELAANTPVVVPTRAVHPWPRP